MLSLLFEITKRSTITSKGQVTIPLEVRTALRLHEGDTVTFEVDSKGQAHLKAEPSKSAFASYAGALRENKALSAKQIVKKQREERGW
jgi:AbrB family looped-hinge helix DNA binding protein